MIPAIGITTQVIREAKWYKHVREFGFNTVEINRQNSKLHFNVYFLEKVKRYLSGFDLSVHSGTSGIFQPRESFTKANLATLSAEIDLCKFLGARQFVFHLSDGFLSPDNKKRLHELVSYARDLGVQMLYESNSTLQADHAYDVLGAFPQLGYVLDLGHLNHGYHSGYLGCEIDDFVGQVKNRAVYIHASNNSGRRDEHKGLNDGTLDWRHVLDLLDISKLSKIIIEVRQAHMIEESARELTRFFEDNALPRKSYAIG